MCCSPNNYKVVHGVFSIRWSRLFLELIWVEAGQLEEAQRREAQPGEGHLGGEEERRKAQHVEAGLVEGRRREVQTGEGQLGEPGALGEEGQLGEAGARGGEGQLGEARQPLWEVQPGLDQLGEVQVQVHVLRSELDGR